MKYCILFPLLFMHIVYAQWIKMNRPTGIVSALAVSPYGAGQGLDTSSGTNLFAGTWGSGIYLSTNNGTTWTVVNTGLTNKYIWTFTVGPNGAGGTNVFAGTDGNGVFLSTDNGSSWSAVNSGLKDTTIRALAVSPNATGGSNLFAGTYGGVFLSTNNGTSWSAVNNGLTSSIIYALAVLDVNLFCGTGDGAFRSTNNGLLWSASNNGLQTTQPIYTFAVNNTYLFAANYGGGSVFLSTNNGANWTAASSGLPTATINTLSAFGENLFAGMNIGVFLTTNKGALWKSENTGLTNIRINAFAVSHNGTGVSHLFVGTEGGGVWRRPLSEMTPVEIFSHNLPANFNLAQNYPNPFNPSTTIRYSLPSSAKVKLTVYDMLGREIATLVDEEQSAGWKETVWNASTVATGIYLYKMQADNFVAIKKLMALK